MSDRLELTGQRFGRLKVLRFAGVKAASSTWECECECGGDRVVIIGKNLRNGNSQSCGCLRHETQSNLIHGCYGTPEYRAWSGMMTRCYNDRESGWANYGGRGIKVCKRWHKFENFLADIGRRPSDDHSIDRIDNDGDYRPGNVRWATAKQQAMNRRPRKRKEKL